MSLPGYDAWKLASPPETDPAEVPCPFCGETDPCACGEDAPESAEDRLLAERLRQLERAGRAVKAGGTKR